jgi:hypothetical protein
MKAAPPISVRLKIISPARENWKTLLACAASPFLNLLIYYKKIPLPRILRKTAVV